MRAYKGFKMRFSDFLKEQAIAKPGDYDFGNLNYVNKHSLTSIEYTFDKSPFVYKVFHNGEEFYFYKEDKNILEDFLKSLGSTYSYGQEKIFNLALENLKVNLSNDSSTDK